MAVVPARHVAHKALRTTRPSALRSLAAGLTAVTLALGAVIAVNTAAVADSATDFPDFDATCPVLDDAVPRGVTNWAPLIEDNRMNTYVGGNLNLDPSSAEIEGPTVVQGDVNVNKGGWYGISVVGVGSQIAPASGVDGLLVGGDITTSVMNPNLDSAARTVRVGGTNAGFVGWNATYVTEGLGPDALVTDNYSPAYDFNGFTPKLAVYSSELAGSGSAGDVNLSGSDLTLDALHQSGVIRFDIPAATLVAATSLSFINLTSTQPVILNITGTDLAPSLTLGSKSMHVTYTDLPGNHVAVNGTTPTTAVSSYPWHLQDWAFMGYSSRFMWNFNGATALTFSSGDQWIGSVVAPAADVVATQSLNGRVYVGGDLTLNGGGNEIHAFPWLGCVSPLSGSATGTFAIAKALTGDEAAEVPGTTAFTVNYTVNGTPAVVPLTILADGTVENGPVLDEGDVVVFAEATPPAVAGVEWGAITVTVDGVPTNTLTISDGGNAAVVVTNTANTPVVVPDDATFEVTKVIDGPAAGLVSDTVQFTIDWEATSGPSTGANGTIVLTTDGIVSGGTPALKVGDVISFTEQTPPAVTGVVWATTPTIPDLTLTTAGNTASFTVTNTANAPAPLTGTFSIAKALGGNAAGIVPGGTAFTVNYTVNGTPAATPLTILANGTVENGPVLDAGDVVVFAEATPPTVTNVVWGSATITVDGTPTSTLTIADGGNATVLVTNTATAQTGSVSLSKTVVGPDGAGSDFEFSWTATAPVGITLTVPQLSGTVVVAGDGAPVTLAPQFPVGTTVTFAEISAPSFTGWSGPAVTFVPGGGTSAAVTQGATVNVAATNTYQMDPKVSIGDLVWVDLDGNGIQNGTDPGIPGVVLRISQTNGLPVLDIFGDPVADQVTGPHGEYLFDYLPILPAGQRYTVTVDQVASAAALAAYLPTVEGATQPEYDSSTWVAEAVELLVDGAHDGSLDFGFVYAEVLGDTGPAGVMPMLGTALALLAAGLLTVLGVRRRVRE